MRALRFQTRGRYSTSPASLRVVVVVVIAVVVVVVVADVVVIFAHCVSREIKVCNPTAPKFHTKRNIVAIVWIIVLELVTNLVVVVVVVAAAAGAAVALVVVVIALVVVVVGGTVETGEEI